MTMGMTQAAKPQIANDLTAADLANALAAGWRDFVAQPLFGLFFGGVFTGQERAWHALHFNWLYFTVISTAGTAFAAVQRIVTGRWSRPVVRSTEGFVAFVPVAFVILLVILLFGKAVALFASDLTTLTVHNTSVDKAAKISVLIGLTD